MGAGGGPKRTHALVRTRTCVLREAGSNGELLLGEEEPPPGRTSANQQSGQNSDRPLQGEESPQETGGGDPRERSTLQVRADGQEFQREGAEGRTGVHRTDPRCFLNCKYAAGLTGPRGGSDQIGHRRAATVSSTNVRAKPRYTQSRVRRLWLFTPTPEARRK